MKTNLKILWITVLFALCFGERVGHAGPVAPLINFTAGTPAKASEVNGNFSAVSTAVNDNASRITTLETHFDANGNITLVPSTATAGNILKGTAPFIHNFGTDNTFIGVNAGNFTMTGTINTAIGARALQNNTTGIRNTASGTGALQNNTTADDNTASGEQALFSNTTGFSNTASGQGALFSNTTGSSNTASGQAALTSNTIGNNNTASGQSALAGNTIGNNNTASGGSALTSNTTGNFNTASGKSALASNTTGSTNTASGQSALFSNTTGFNNTAIGFNAGSTLTTGNNNIDIGNVGGAGESNTIRIGTPGTHISTFIAGISGVTTGLTGVAVLVDANGQLGTVSSSRRVKDDIADMGGASDVLMKLRPVTFHYSADRNPAGRTLQYGLVAEEVAEVAPGLVAHSADGRIETVYYQFLAPMLLNEYQKQQRTIEGQAVELTKQTARVAELEQDRRLHVARIEALENQAARTAGLLRRLEQAGMITTAGR